jgi:protein tyrosine phosphatase
VIIIAIAITIYYWNKESQSVTSYKNPPLIKPHVPLTTKTLDQIIPHLFLGNLEDASDINLLNKYDIKYIINISGFENKFPKKFVYYKININDSPNENIFRYFRETGEFINNAVSTGKNILVHCHAGISRSASIIIAYLISWTNRSFDQSYSLVKSRRPIINPNPGFINQLKKLEKDIKINISQYPHLWPSELSY